MRRSAGRVLGLLFLQLFPLLACDREPVHAPLRLLDRRTTAGALPRQGSLTTGGETRPALLETARFRVALPRRGLLTFGIGHAYAGRDEAPGWYRLTVKAGDQVLFERTTNPRVAHGFRNVSVPIERLGRESGRESGREERGRETTLEFDLRLTSREGNPLSGPPDLLLGVADPVLHDLDAYGGAKGVLLISIDTLRRDHVGAHGYARPTTPRLDALGRDGILCEDAVSTSSWTLPAHLSMLTSVSPSVHGGVDMNHGFNHRVPTLAATLKGAGFATQAVTSHLYVSPVYGVDDGFDHMDFRQDRKATEVADAAISLLDRLGDRPFFLFLHFYDPHWHYDPPERFRRMFDAGYTGRLTGLWQDFSKRNRSNTSPADLAHLLALYDGEIRYTDEEIGRVLDHMKARGLDRGTLVVVTSDHGEEFLDHGSWEHQKTLYEEVVRIPLLFAGPGVARRREPAQTSLLDVAPTILAWAGVAPAAPLQGKSLLAPPGEREAHGETDHTIDGTHKLFLRAGAGRWKTILSLSRDGGLVKREEWYDLHSDPEESRDARPQAAVAEAIRSRAVAQWREERGRGAVAPAVCLSAEQRERLRALGYIGGAPEGTCRAKEGAS